MVNVALDTLGSTIKRARLAAGYTQEQLAERLDISPRYIMFIEKSQKKPRYELLYKIIRELNIAPDLIFYPEKPSKDFRIEDLVRLLYSCDENALSILTATAKATLEATSKK